MPAVEEGSARIVVGRGVFYNPGMRALRDMSVLFLRATNAKGRLLDCTAATGVRGIRYAREAGFRDIVSLDINAAAAANASANIKRNGLVFECRNESVQRFCNGDDAGQFDVIDLDPFGTPVPHVNDLLKVSKDGTLLMITATDTAVLCGAHASACLKLYGSKPMHNELCKESGIRILLNFVIRSSAQFNFGVEPLLSVSDMHYMRVFVRLHAGAKEALGSVRQCGFASFCGKCRSFSYAKGTALLLGAECGDCGAGTEAFGPMYLGALYEKRVVERMVGDDGMQKSGRAGSLLARIHGELDAPFFYSIPRITRTLRMSSVPMDNLIERLRDKGFSVSRTQFDKDGIKTDAGAKTVADAIRGLGHD
ncbi:MAG: tRNA (guanine(10)-N(2))-dimethyltransferase [Candidatus Marsarchaeota archaeon]|nr:tRNA (guanine(10)-N(2))-dimethyltransferase [Candidatus Marsarchaeota archaeon]